MIALALLSLGLAMDAVAAAVAHGASTRAGGQGAVKLGAAFGLAQGLMPIAGWTLGLIFVAGFSRIDHWIALVLLTIVGVRIIHEALTAGDEGGSSELSGWTILSTAIATSIDAAAAGVTLPTIGLPLLLSCAAIGGTTALLSFGGVYLGAFAGARIGKGAEILGGAILIALGLKIFIQHQFLGG